MEWCHDSLMCVVVQCGKTCCFVVDFTTESFLIKVRPKIHDFLANLGPPSCIQEFLGNTESGCLKHREKGSPQLRGPKASRQPCKCRSVLFFSDSKTYTC